MLFGLVISILLVCLHTLTHATTVTYDAFSSNSAHVKYTKWMNDYRAGLDFCPDMISTITISYMNNLATGHELHHLYKAIIDLILDKNVVITEQCTEMLIKNSPLLSTLPLGGETLNEKIDGLTVNSREDIPRQSGILRYTSLSNLLYDDNDRAFLPQRNTYAGSYDVNLTRHTYFMSPRYDIATLEPVTVSSTRAAQIMDIQQYISRNGHARWSGAWTSRLPSSSSSSYVSKRVNALLASISTELRTYREFHDRQSQTVMNAVLNNNNNNNGKGEGEPVDVPHPTEVLDEGVLTAVRRVMRAVMSVTSSMHEQPIIGKCSFMQCL